MPNQISYRNIKVTYHAKQRAAERLGIYKESEIQKFAHAAKYKGVKISPLNSSNYSYYGLSYDMFRYLKNHYTHRYKTDKTYYYRNYVFVFSGDGSKSLKSIVPCYEEDMRKAIEKLDNPSHSAISEPSVDM